jgi:hypothetical protein
MKRKLIIFLIMNIFITPLVKGQDVEKVLHADSVSKSFINKLLETQPIVASGSVNARTVVAGGEKNSVPFTYLLNGNLNLEIFGFNMPLSFSFSNKKFNYSYSSPITFNRIKLNPHYKWIKLYLGQTSLSYSPYTLSGIQFSGVGIELTPPGPFRIGAMRGRFYKAVPYNPEYSNQLPVYQRDGQAFMVGFQKDKFKLETSFFDATDKASSIVLPTDTLIAVTPMSNISCSLKGSFMPLKLVNLDIEYALSALNKNIDKNRYSLTEMLTGDRPYLERFNAWKLGINFSPGKLKTGVSIEHIDPGYKTLGAYYSRSDFQNITLNLATNLFKNKISVNINSGIENDNLKNQKTTGNTRFVGSATIALNASEKFNASLNYSNFQSFTNMKNQFDYINKNDPFINVDTLGYSQINQNANLSMNYSMGDPKVLSQNLSAQFSLNGSSNTEAGSKTTLAMMYNSCANWSITNPVQNWGANLGVNTTLSNMNNLSILTWGPQAALSKMIMDKKMILSASGGFNQTNSDGNVLSNNINIRSSCRYKLNKMHNFTLDLTWLNRKSANLERVGSFSISLSYVLTLKKQNFFKPIRTPEKNEESSNNQTDEQ